MSTEPQFSVTKKYLFGAVTVWYVLKDCSPGIVDSTSRFKYKLVIGVNILGRDVWWVETSSSIAPLILTDGDIHKFDL